MDDRELDAMLREWPSPGAPPRLRDTVFPPRRRWWAADIRIPVPVAIALALLMLAGLWQVNRTSPLRAPVTEVTFRELQPVKELKPRIIRRHYE
jgi:hypothetical protein